MLRLIALAALLPLDALAHGGASVASGALEAFLWVSIASSGSLYALGVGRLWRRAGRGRGISKAQAARFAAGWLALAVALLSPVDALGTALFSMHMVQHELLMVVAAPLLVLARPLEAWAWALAPGPRRALAGASRWRSLRRLGEALTSPAGAWVVHAAALWAWHVPSLFESALRHPGLHALQHASFLGSALLFWWSVFGRGVRAPDMASVASLFGTMMHSGALGALLTFSPVPWYGAYSATAAYGFTALEDQQLGGLVMWVPGSLAYLAAGLGIVARWLRPGWTPAAR